VLRSLRITERYEGYVCDARAVAVSISDFIPAFASPTTIKTATVRVERFGLPRCGPDVQL